MSQQWWRPRLCRCRRRRRRSAPPPDKTALVLGGTTIPTPDQAYLDAVRDLFVEPTHPGQHIDYVAVTTPEEGWPLTGVVRLILLVTGPPSLVGLDGPCGPTSRGGNSRGCSTSHTINRTRLGTKRRQQRLTTSEVACASHDVPTDLVASHGINASCRVSSWAWRCSGSAARILSTSVYLGHPAHRLVLGHREVAVVAEVAIEPLQGQGQQGLRVGPLGGVSQQPLHQGGVRVSRCPVA